jgi:ATP-dependent HslUV protease subunit HslV
MASSNIHGTTVLAVRHGGRVVMAGGGQVSAGNTVLKAAARKVRRLHGGKVLGGFAGATADALTLFERFEGKLDKYSGNLARASVEMAKDWRSDRMLRRLDAMLMVADASATLLLTGAGDVIEPDDGLVAIGSGGNYALAAARALVAHSSLDARTIAEESMRIAASICVFTNGNLTIEELP